MRLPHRCLFLSDLHLGTGRTRAKTLWELLQREPSEQVILVGDVLDLTAWKRRGPRFSAAEWRVLQWLLERQRSGQLIWLLGNHEQPLRDLLEGQASISWIRERLIYTSLEGQRLLVTHGDQLECAAMEFGALEELGIRLLNKLEGQHHRFNLGLPSPSALLLRSGKGQRLIKAFHDRQHQAARDMGVDGIICGHIHGPLMEQRHGVLIINTGCWTHPPGSAVVETACGEWQLLDGQGGRRELTRMTTGPGMGPKQASDEARC